ncbi:ribonuclease P protein subunit POP4 [Halogranum gelatinilyticum]|uniref:Ribonuclease P protein component 1 n=1 Tax=Halogranum gelatinilyticum TaxID=660521 RepID=A0A1G9UH06_9EURY|nr:ribonuclease P protein component 1 [Halogranum gelatinilyticum]SDM59201.1 ribonuclease P protein subunit POP4 [Halogranum gelatinilyticum]
MALTPETLLRHELNGLPVRVVDAANPDLVGIAGRVVVETMQTLHVDDGTRVRQVPKRGATLEFALTQGEPASVDTLSTDRTRTDEAAVGRKASGSTSKRESETAGVLPGQSGSTREGSPEVDEHPSSSHAGDCQDVVYVTVDGVRLLSRPANRTEVTGDSKWR